MMLMSVTEKRCLLYTDVRIWICYNEYIANKGIMNSGQSSTELNDMLTNFVSYVDSFYGVNDPLYPMMSRETKQPLNKHDILCATENYLSMCSDDSNKLCVWGDGDSLDRESQRHST